MQSTLVSVLFPVPARAARMSVGRIGQGRVDHTACGTNCVWGGVPRIRIFEGHL